MALPSFGVRLRVGRRSTVELDCEVAPALLYGEFPILLYRYTGLHMARRFDSDSQISRQLRLRDLHLFFSVVQCGSMAKAASYLGISQPNVSEVIASLERTLGVRLFDRSPQGVEPTLYGQALLKRSVAVFDELKQGIKDIEFLSNPDSGELRIACGITLSAAILPPIIHGFAQAYPRVVLEVHEAPPPTRAQLSGLRDRKFDLVLGRLVTPLALDPFDDDANVELLCDDTLVVMAGMHSRFAHRRKIGLADLVDEPWIIAEPNTWNYTRMTEAFHACGLAMPKVSIVSSSINVTAHLLSNGRYLTANSKLLAVRYALKVLPVSLPAAHAPIVVITLKNRTLSPLVERFIAYVRDFMRTSPGVKSSHGQ
jgi:DNA-binding transcriptional LysR family regulator